MTNSDTIAAISTPIGTGGIGVIRLSGPDAIKIADRIFKSPSQKPLCDMPTHTIHYGHIYDPETGEMADEVLLSLMRAPKTFTAEDTVEISTHGSVAVLKRVLLIVLQNGARHAEAGEFTKRAFLNGRIDLSRAEAVIDVIRSDSSASLSNALSQLEGSLANAIEDIRQPLLYALAQFAAAVDYPDEDICELDYESAAKVIDECTQKCDALLSGAHDGRIAKEGICCVLAGRPNVGKSSVLNTLSGASRAIVTDIAGTTRDIIEENITIDRIAIRLIDTAGIRKTDDKVEKIGVDRCIGYINSADIVLVVLDSSRPLSKEDIEVLTITKNKRRIILLNKSDLESATAKKDVESYISGDKIINISALNKDGISELKKEIISICGADKINTKSVMISNARHIAAVQNAKQALICAKKTLTDGLPMDMCAIDVTEALEQLGQITGVSVSADIVDKIFAEFCVGK